MLFKELYIYFSDKNVINIILDDYLDNNLKYAKNIHKNLIEKINKEYHSKFICHDNIIFFKESLVNHFAYNYRTNEYLRYNVFYNYNIYRTRFKNEVYCFESVGKLPKNYLGIFSMEI